jgi:hypothetical protein
MKQKVYLMLLMPVCVGLIMLAGVFLSVPTNQTTMNVRLLAASAFLDQSGTLFVSHNGFINFFAIFQC